MGTSAEFNDSISHILEMIDAVENYAEMEKYGRGLKKQNSKGWEEDERTRDVIYTPLSYLKDQVQDETNRLKRSYKALDKIAKYGLNEAANNDKAQFSAVIKSAAILGWTAAAYSSVTSNAMKEMDKFLRDKKNAVIFEAFFGDKILAAIIQARGRLTEFRDLLDNISNAADQAAKRVGKDSGKAMKKKK